MYYIYLLIGFDIFGVFGRKLFGHIDHFYTSPSFRRVQQTFIIGLAKLRMNCRNLVKFVMNYRNLARFRMKLSKFSEISDESSNFSEI